MSMDQPEKAAHPPLIRASVLTSTLLKGNWQKSLRSIANQSLRSSEVVVVVDNPDAPAEELERFAQEAGNMVVVRNEVNKGLAASLNRAAEVARGDILVRHDDDDLSVPNRIERLVSYFDSHPEVDILCSHAMGHQEHGNFKKTWRITTPSSDREIKAALEIRNCIVHPTMAIRSHAFQRLGGYDPRFRFAQDYDLFLRSSRSGLIFACVPEVLVERSYSADSVTVKHRYSQATYSFAAKLLYKAEKADRKVLIRDVLKYLSLLLAPRWLRQLRRMIGWGR